MAVANGGSWWSVAGLLVIPALIALNAFFVAAEFALVAMRRTRVEELVSQGKPRSHALLTAMDQLNISVAAAQLGITLASLALGLLSEPALAHWLHPLFSALPDWWDAAATHTISVILTLAIITYLHVVFGEQMPKIAALQSAERVALWIAPPLNAFARISRPIINLLNGSSNWFLRLIGYRASESDGEIHTVDELRLLVEDTEEAGLIDEDQADILQNVFMLSDKTVVDCMLPREKMASLNTSMTSDEIMAAVREGAHTRMPVFDQATDKVIGIVNTKHLYYLFSSPKELVSLLSLGGAALLDEAMYPATYLDPQETIANALNLFKKSHKHMAIVRDSDEKILGMVTLEDVVEEIVGDIEDEHDRPVRRLRLRLPKGTGLTEVRIKRDADSKTLRKP